VCRHLAYLGPPCSVGELLARGPHSLQSQGWAPRDMRGGGTVNADGYGAAWWVDGAPVRYRTARPVWNDEAGAAVLGSARSGAVLAAVRSATVGMPVVHTANAPFTDGRWAFSHNGTVRGWPGSLARLAAELPITDVLTLDAPTDSALLWAAVRARLDSDDPADVLAELVRSVGASAPESRLNLLLTDGEQVVATTWYHSLSVLVTEDAVLVASEPHDDDPAWRPVPDHSLVTARPGHVAVTPLDP
jgi:glutamine amidotransferase